MSGIQAPDKETMEACRLYVDNLIKPIHSLGKLEDIAVRLAGITGKIKPGKLNKAIVIMAGDTAVDGENKTGGKTSLTEVQMVSRGLGTVSAVARTLGAPVYLIDVGLEQNTNDIEGVLTNKVVYGTHRGNPALDQDAVSAAISIGMSVARTLAVQGIQAVGLGNIGERSLLSALGVTAAIMKKELQENSLKDGFSLHMDDVGNMENDPINVFSHVGSAEIAGLFGLVVQSAASDVYKRQVVQAAREKIAIVFDNAVTGAAVLAAIEVYPEVRDYVFPSAAYNEPVHQIQMKKLGMKPFFYYDFTVAEGFGSAMGLSLFDAALDMVNEMKTFGQGGVDVAEDGPGKGRQREDVQ